jgi:5-methylcytosine-specific restriction endonuclease McrA
MERATKRYEGNKEAKAAYDINRYHTNPKVREQQREWRARTPEKQREYKERWKQKYPDRHREVQRRYTANNPEKVQSNVRNRRARVRNAVGSHTRDDIHAILVRQKYQCAECGASVKKRCDRQVDHIMPLKLGGSNSPSNLQILCNTCNKVKGAKHPIDFAQERGRLV